MCFETFIGGKPVKIVTVTVAVTAAVIVSDLFSLLLVGGDVQKPGGHLLSISVY
jgi:hypothetical protein